MDGLCTCTAIRDGRCPIHGGRPLATFVLMIIVVVVAIVGLYALLQ